MASAVCDNCGKRLSSGDLGARVKIDFRNERYYPVHAIFCVTCANKIAKPLPAKTRESGRRLNLPQLP